jgi:uncharacterized iron-regulated membrane protein
VNALTMLGVLLLIVAYVTGLQYWTVTGRWSWWQRKARHFDGRGMTASADGTRRSAARQATVYGRIAAASAIGGACILAVSVAVRVA